MIIKRRYPNFSSGFEETEHEVSNYEELIKIDWVENIMKYKSQDGKDDFVALEFNPSSFDDSPALLMAISEMSYLVVGYIYGDPIELGLNEWKHK